MIIDFTRTLMTGILIAAGVFVVADLSGLETGQAPQDSTGVEALFHGPNGQPMGRALLFQTKAGLMIRLDIDNVPAGIHGVRVDPAVGCGQPLGDAIPLKLATVHAGLDGRIRADLLTEEVRLAGGTIAHGLPLTISLRPGDGFIGPAEPNRLIACAEVET